MVLDGALRPAVRTARSQPLDAQRADELVDWLATTSLAAVTIGDFAPMKGGFRVSEEVNRGIYDDFQGYHLPREDQLNSALQSRLDRAGRDLPGL